MKANIFFKLIILTVFIGLFNACQSDDADPVKTNQIKVTTNSFNVTNAVLIDDGSTFNGVTELELFLTTSGITVLNVNGELEGKGDFLSLTLFSSEQSALKAGSYSYNDQDGSAFLLNRGFHFFNFDAALGDGQTGDKDIESGNVIVEVANNQYTITINLVDESGNTVTGYYKGALQLLN